MKLSFRLAALCLALVSFLLFSRFKGLGQSPSDCSQLFKLPQVIGGWKGEDIPVDASAKAILETEGVMMRRYADDQGYAVVLAVVYYPGNHIALHLPESCLMGQGSRLTERSKDELFSKGMKFDAVRLVTKGTAEHLVLYYFQTASYCSGSYFNFRKAMLQNALRGQPHGGGLVRFSINVGENGGQREKCLAKLREFMAEAGSLLAEYMP